MRYLLAVAIWIGLMAGFLFWWHRRPRQKIVHYWAEDVPTAKFEQKFFEDYERDG